MKWWKKYLTFLIKFMHKIKIPVSSKPKRPKSQQIFLSSIVDGEFKLSERYIIVNDCGEVLETQLFLCKEDAENWLDEHYPKHKYDLD